MNRLFAVYLGGPCKGATVELHDVVFVVAPSVKAAFPILKKKWFGDKSGVHVDSWIELTQVDGHDIRFTPPTTKIKNPNRLFFINVGYYQADKFGEQHDFLFLAGTSQKEIKERAKKHIQNQVLVHIDNLAEVDDLLEINEIDGEKIYLTPSDVIKPLKINSVYWPI